jgi:polyisoprenoid-binding protein YceI
MKFVLLLLSICLLSFANNTLYKSKTGSISFKSDLALETIKATSKELKGIIDPNKKTFAFKVLVKTFEGFNSPLQKEHFNENYMMSDKFPEATFLGKIIEDIDFTKDGTYTVRAKGKLNLHGVDQERIIKSDLIIKGKSIKIKSSFSVLLSDFLIAIPKVVSEKLANEIKVDVQAELTQE